ncbi:MAG: glycosyltransferase [Verrucomicrobiota bacterium]
MSNLIASLPRPVAKGKFLFVGEEKFFIQGVTYGPFKPESDGDAHFKSPEMTKKDFALIRDGGFNVLRIYHTPPKWFLDLAVEYGLRALITVPWKQRVLFLDNAELQEEIQNDVRAAARANAGHPAILGFYVDNEIPSDLVRWYGAPRVERFLDSLVKIVKEADPTVLCSYANFPSTEYLLPRTVDFYSYNVYLHDPKNLSAYLARLQNLAEEKPLILSEFGMDTIRHSEDEQADLLDAHYETVFRSGLSGTIIFSWTDEWFTNGIEVEDWAFGLVQRDRSPKKAYHRLKQKNILSGESIAKKYPIKDWPKVSVVVCSYNGAATLRPCMESLQDLSYPNYEVILVDDGSRDNTQDIMKDFPAVKNIIQENKGLSVARNVGAEASTGDIIAYTDSDCMADKDWLYYLVHTLVENNFAAVGGPNISPPAANSTQAAVAVSPGAPRHVLLNDTEAEHIPGCNMAYHRWALEVIGGFDPEFRAAGDDVDVCWRLMQLGHKIGFSPSAVVWHYRRFTIDAYFKQQRGYGKAEALLRYKHIYYFDSFGSARWKGVIYGQPRFDEIFHRPLVYHGIFGTGGFQCVYPQPHSAWFNTFSSIEWIGTAIFILLVSYWFDVLRIVPLLMFGLFLLPALSYMMGARIEPKHDSLSSRLVIFYLALVQPLVREWARYFAWLQTPSLMSKTRRKVPRQKHRTARGIAALWQIQGDDHLAFWSEKGVERTDLLRELGKILEEEDWKFANDSGWGDWDMIVFVNRWWRIRIKTLTEIYPNGKRLTRVDNELTLRKFSLLVGFCVFTIILVVGQTLPDSIPYFLFASFILLATWIAVGLSLRHQFAHIIHTAAMRVGLIPVKNSKNTSIDCSKCAI